MLTRSHTGKVKLVCLLALALSLLFAVPALAGPPVIETGEEVLDYLPPQFQVCPGIEVWDHEVYSYRQTAFFDNQGTLLRIRLHLVGTDHFYNPENPGVVLAGSYSASADIDLQTGELINGAGTPVHITVPGYGTVMLRAGFWSRWPDSQFGGKNSIEDPDDLAAFCSLLAGE
jgi:hypothetical protein